MARFKYNGEPARSYVSAYGNCTVISVPKKDGTIQSLTPISPATYFVITQDIGYEITDEFSLVAMRNNSRFTEL